MVDFYQKLKHNQQQPEPLDVLTFADVKLAFEGDFWGLVFESKVGFSNIFWTTSSNTTWIP